MSTKNADSPPESKCCNCCGQRLPSAAFRRVYRDRDWPRHSECRDCRNAQDRRRRERSRRKSLRRQITALAAADNARQVKALAGAMVGAAGGFDRFNQQFAELWNGKLTPATQQRLFASVLNLAGSADEATRFAEQQRHVEEDRLRELQSDELGRMTERELEEYAADMLRCAGWRVRPPMA